MTSFSDFPTYRDSSQRSRRRSIQPAVINAALSMVSGALTKSIYDKYQNRNLNKNVSTGYKTNTRMAYTKTKTRTARKTTKRAKARTAVDKSQQKQLTAIRKRMNATDGTHVHRTIFTDEVQCGVNVVNYSGVESINTANIELALQLLRYYDPADPATLVNAPGSIGTYSRNFFFKTASSSMHVRNNYAVPVQVRLYACTPKDDTDINPVTAFTNGISDVMITPNTDSIIVYPTDSEQFAKLWKIEKTVTKLLQPGATFDTSYSNKPFYYDPSNVDSHNLDFQKKYGALVWMFRIGGEVGHNSGSSTQGILQAGIDFCMKNTYKIVYDAGVNLTDVSVTETLGASPTLLTNKPASSQQDYTLTT